MTFYKSVWQFNTVGYYNTLRSRLQANESTLLNVLRKSAERQAISGMQLSPSASDSERSSVAGEHDIVTEQVWDRMYELEQLPCT